jgi:predicted transposase YbfD/YdcC
MNNQFKESFGNIEDPRVDRTKLHNLLDIIALGILGAMAGAQGFEEIEDFGKTHEEWLRKSLVLENGIPSHDTISRVFGSLNHMAFQEAFLSWIKQIKTLLPENVVPIDGKTLRGSHQRSKGLNGLHVVSAWSCANGLSLGQLKVDGKSNEITAIPELIKRLLIEGAIITIDAMGCQKDIAKQIREQKADYVLGLKGNQGNLAESVRDCFKLNDGLFPIYAARDEIACEHGRLEERQIEVLDGAILQGLVDISQWHSLNSIIKMTYTSEVLNKKVRRERSVKEELFYISSLNPKEPNKILQAIRAHWSIESMHWSLDVTFKEDTCRVRDETTALNLSWLRKLSLSFLKAETSFKASIRRKQLKLWSSPQYFLKVFSMI